MATAPPPPPLHLLPPCVIQPHAVSPPPLPGHAAIPYCSTPVQETSPSPEALHHAEVAPPPLPLPVQNGPQCPPPQEDNPPESEEKKSPVQETDPAPQMTEQQDEAEV